jgi:lysine/ornithine N-monooxygenase
LSKQYGHARTQPSIQPDRLLSLYNKYYAQQILKPGDEQSSLVIQQFFNIIGAEKIHASNQVSLQLQNTINHSVSTSEAFDFVFATGYSRDLHKILIQPLKEYFDDRDGNISLSAGYRVHLNRKYVKQEAGIWVLDGYENGAEDAFPFMALRTERVLKSILGAGKVSNKEDASASARENVEWATL